MNSRQRLVNLAIAAVIAVVAVVIIIATSGGDDEGEREAAATPAATTEPQQPEAEPGASEEPTPKPTPTAEPVPLIRFEGGELVDGVEEISVDQGDRVRFDVVSDVPEEVHVHAYDLMTDLEPGKKARISFEATITGVIEIELEDSATEIVELRVNP